VKRIEFLLDTDNEYIAKKMSCLNVSRLGMFLDSDVRSLGTTRWLKWIDTANSHNERCANMTCLIKRGNNINIYQEADDEEDASTPSFETSKENLKYILDRWAQALEEKPKKVIITQDDNDKITVDFEN